MLVREQKLQTTRNWLCRLCNLKKFMMSIILDSDIRPPFTSVKGVFYKDENGLIRLHFSVILIEKRNVFGGKLMNLEIMPAYDFQQEIGALFTEYTDMLVQLDQAFGVYLKIQNYDEEVKHLEQKYGFPDGRLYLAYLDGRPTGCIGLRKIDEANCEMKRLFVRPEFRGRKIGRVMIEKIIGEARQIGYRYMLLDTMPCLQSATRLYKDLGFYEIPSYNNSPMEGLLYLKFDL